MREEIWTEKIFKDDAGYFLRITKTFKRCKITTNEGDATPPPRFFCSERTVLSLKECSKNQVELNFDFFEMNFCQ